MLFFGVLLTVAAGWAIRALYLIVFADTLYLSYSRGATPRRVRAGDHRFERNAQAVFFLAVLAVVAVSAVVILR